jgi:dipeptidyl-peptidase-4
MSMSESFPRLQARTRRFTLGVPRGFTISPDGGRVVFLRTRSGVDPVTCLWELDVASGEERLIADPHDIDVTEDLPPQERARRERTREQAGGIVAYSADRQVTRAVFALSGDLYVTEPTPGATPRHLATPGPVIDPRLSPDGARVAYVTGGELHVLDVASGDDTTLAAPERDGVTYGLADFIAAEELDRTRGHWWAPTSDAVLAERADDPPVRRWHIADPANPGREPVTVGYPAAGTPNAEVSLAILRLDGSRAEVPFADEYLANARWTRHGLHIVTMPRDQRTVRLLSADPATGATTTIREDTDPAWVDVIPSIPAHLSDGTLVWLADSDDARRLVIAGAPVTPPTLRVRDICDVDGDTVLFRAGADPTVIDLWTWTRTDTRAETGAEAKAAGERTRGVLTRVGPDEPGVHSGRLAGGTLVLSAQTLSSEGPSIRVIRDGRTVAHVTSLAERPGITPRVTLLRTGARDLATAVLLPSWHTPGSARLPVLMDPYGGPHAQRVLAANGAYLTSQWFADQGFAVIVADGRGTPGRGPAFEREVLGDLATPALDDQVDALQGAATHYPDDLDLTRVAIRGWSFGGYLAALAVLRRPDVFHAAIAGAPVTDWRLYDTGYTERYLGHPDDDPGPYDRSSLLADAPKLDRPLLLIHGLADDNVVAAHTLRLSSALLAAGRPHTVLPLSGVTHMTPQEVVAENLLLLQVDFLKKSLLPGG